MSAKPKKRITTMSYGDKISVPVDADEQWKGFTGMDFFEQVQSVSECFFWQVQLPWIDLPEETRKQFWNGFQQGDAVKARSVAVHGIPYANKIEALNLLNDAIEFERNLTSGRFKGEKMKDAFQSGAMSIGLRFSKMAEMKDHCLFQQLADLIKAGGIDAGEKPKGGEPSLNGQIIRDFCQLVRTSRTLPTKKQLRDSLDIGAGTSKVEKFRVALIELGLGGLPTAK